MALPFASCWFIPKQPFETDKEIFDKITELRIEAIQPVELGGGRSAK
jgi:hypothetical protein